MITTTQKKCPNCKKKVTVLWQQIQGMRLTDEKGKCKAQCPECGHEWRTP